MIVTWSLLLLCVVEVKVELRACEDRVKVNYFRLVLDQREPQLIFKEQREAHQRNLVVMQNQEEQDQG